MKSTEGALTYREAGVDVAAADGFVSFALKRARATNTRGVVLHDLGYSGLFRPESKRGARPLLAATCDGVGTKLLIARELGQYDDLGQDLVAMSVNDLVPVGARPLFFLDYIASGALDRRVLDRILKSIATACRAVGCALLGGETAEMPGLYQGGDFDLAGFAVGMTDERTLPKKSSMRPGDVVLGLPSTGIHSNGLSLARAALLTRGGLSLTRRYAPLDTTLGRELLKPTALYPHPVLKLFSLGEVRAAAHVTGGGIHARAGKLAPRGLGVVLELHRVRRPGIFDLIADVGGVSEAELQRTFNLGLGFLAVVPPATARKALRAGLGFLDVGHVEKRRTSLVVRA